MKRVLLTTLLTTGLVASSAFAANELTIQQEGDVIVFQTREAFGTATLHVTGPKRYDYTATFEKDNTIVFKIFDGSPDPRDGRYRWSLSYVQPIDPEIQEAINKARLEDNACFVDELKEAGKFESGTWDGSFLLLKGQMIVPETQSGDEKSYEVPDVDTTPAKAADAGGEGPELDAQAKGLTKDFVINDDLIVDGSACIGFDCVNGESFSFDTIRLKENNLRIKFDDTSVAASYPRNDWQITANDSANGGASKFSIEDVSGSRTPFTIEANARSHSLYVDDGGRIGNRTSTPSTEIHSIDGDTPTLRLQQDGSSGFAPQTWDIAGNETNFFIRDVTNGSQLPFRIRPGADTSSIFIDADSDVGISTASPEARLHVNQTSSSSNLIMRLTNNGRAQLEIENTNIAGDPGAIWRYDVNNAGVYSIIPTNPGTVAMSMTTAGDVTIAGSLTTAMNNYPDYVFEDDYELMPLDDLAAFIDAQGHLPNIKSEAEVGYGKTVNMTELSRGLLEKVEELTLYTLQQHETDKALRATIDAQSALIEKLEARLAALENVD